MKLKKKGTITIEAAPAIVLIVGLVFLVMATFAFIGERYGDALLTDTEGSVTNESGAYINGTSYTLATAGTFGFKSPAIVVIHNASDGVVISSGNYTLSSAGVLTNTTATNWNNVNVSYTYVYNPRTTAYNSTADLQTELGNNTSIAGIVLTISLVGIVLSLLIGVFLSIGRKSSRI